MKNNQEDWHQAELMEADVREYTKWPDRVLLITLIVSLVLYWQNYIAGNWAFTIIGAAYHVHSQAHITKWRKEAYRKYGIWL